MFDFKGSPVPVRVDLRSVYQRTWDHLASPGPTLSGEQRIGLLGASRTDSAQQDTPSLGIDIRLGTLADTLYHRPAKVDGSLVRAAADPLGDPTVVETIALISMLSSIDGTHRALGADLEPLPEPQPGDPTANIALGMKRRRTHIPVPGGPIPFMLDLLPEEGIAFQALFGPQYMTGEEMAYSDFERTPGLNRAQIEIVSSRTSVINECFY